LVAAQADVLALEENLDAVVQVVVEHHLGDGGVDGDLKLRPIELAQGTLDDAVVLLVGVDQERVVGDVSGDPYARQNRLGSSAERCRTARATGAACGSTQPAPARPPPRARRSARRDAPPPPTPPPPPAGLPNPPPAVPPPRPLAPPAAASAWRPPNVLERPPLDWEPKLPPAPLPPDDKVV